jgi:hypothetical protein
VSLLKPVSRDASRPNREHNSRPPPDLVHNEPEFEVEAVLKSRQLRGREREYLVKWKGYHPIEASWVNESDMEHAQEAIEEFHARPAKLIMIVGNILPLLSDECDYHENSNVHYENINIHHENINATSMNSR